MELLKQTKDAVKDLPLFFKAVIFVWGSVPLWLIVPSIKNYNLLSTTYAFFFALIWIMINLSITLVTAFRRDNKKALKKYAEENPSLKISGQLFAAALQSNSAYKNLVTMLPAHLTNDLGLYVAAKWGRISKLLFISLSIVYMCVTFLAPH